MPPHKRNRSSAAFLQPEEANGAMNTPRNTGSPLDDDKPEPLYRIEILRDVNTTPKSKGKKGAKKGDYTTPKNEPAIAPETEAVTYTILPGSNWEGMKKYKNFIVGENTFGVHDYVYVNNEEGHRGNEQGDDEDEAEDDQKGWVAFVLEIRAKSPNHVYLRVFWMYRPRDLPAGRLHYHGHSELIASNHMDIIDAMTVIDEAQVMHMQEEDDEPAVEGLYWRQTFNVVNGKLSLLRRACICHDYHNPDKLLLQCSNEDCKMWLHQDCIIKHALEKAMARVSNEDDSDSGSGSTNEATGTIKVAQSSRRSIKADEIQPSSSKGSIKKSNTGKRRRGSKSKSKPKEASYEGKLMGVVETRPKLNDEEISQETTGKLIVTDLRGDERTTSKVDMICPKCEEPLTAQ